MLLETLVTEDQIRQAVNDLAKRICDSYGDEEVLLVGVLKGSVYFVSDLSRKLGPNIQVDFVQVSSYGNQRSSSGIVRIVKDLDVSIEGKNVLIVEDIVDTGLTLGHLREVFATRHPKSLKVVALLSKCVARGVECPAEYVGFEIPNRFVVGYGLDDAERYRNLPYIAVLPPDDMS